MAMEASKRPRYWRSFVAGEAVDVERNYHAAWNDLGRLVDLIVTEGKWLLITGPFQSGKSSLMYALAEAVRAEGYLAVVTTLTEDMIHAANDEMKTKEARSAFFGRLAASVQNDSHGVLRIREEDRDLGDMGLVLGMFRSSEKEVVWFVDEASLLNDITDPSIITAFLSGLRICKQGSRSKHSSGSFSLRSFVLVGTNRTRRLLAEERGKRVKVARHYSSTSPARNHDPYNPLTGTGSFSPLSLEENISPHFLCREEIFGMLKDYAQERGIIFRTEVEEQVTDSSRELALDKFAKNIYELTSGYKGMVGACCTYLCAKAIHTYSVWRQKVRKGSVAKRVFTDKVYTRILSKVSTYSQELQKLVIDCVQLGGPVLSPARLDILPAINDGVLSLSKGQVSLTSPLLLSAILEDCYMAPQEALSPVATFEDALRVAISYINRERLLMEDSNGQPSEYIWQSEFLVGLKFVLEHGYSACSYKILVEAKRKDKNGRRSLRLNFLLRNKGSPKKGIEVQGVGDRSSIRAHITKCVKYAELHQCEMHYVYFLMGEDSLGAKDKIATESNPVQGLKSWYVQYLPQSSKWNVERYNGGGNWNSRVFDEPNSYPEFMFHN